MRFVLSLTPSDIEFTERHDGGRYPYLIEIGTQRIAVRAGHLSGLDSGESPSLSVTLNNDGNRVASIIGHPLRKLAEAFDDEDNSIAIGLITSVTFGREIQLTMDA